MSSRGANIKGYTTSDMKKHIRTQHPNELENSKLNNTTSQPTITEPVEFRKIFDINDTRATALYTLYKDIRGNCFGFSTKLCFGGHWIS